MSDQFKITLAQLNATVGDLEGNAKKVMKAWEKARDDRSNIIAFPELFIKPVPTNDGEIPCTSEVPILKLELLISASLIILKIELDILTVAVPFTLNCPACIVLSLVFSAPLSICRVFAKKV